MTTRRKIIKAALGGLVLAGGSLRLPRALAGLPPGALESERLESLPGKRPLIKRSYRPPNYETPVEDFRSIITPNDRFFVRWHHGGIQPVALSDWRLFVGGDGATKPYELTFDALKHDFEPVEVVAVCQCSGNRRGFSQPHVAGVQWGHGAMGNARWKGARLKDVLERAGLRAEGVEIAFDGADEPYLDGSPDFVKSLPTWKALDENTLVAYEMNGAPLPHLNGFPVRVVVPGWTATYWLKQLTRIRILTEPLDSFWMKTAYRLPRDKFPAAARFDSQTSETTAPITDIVVNSLITDLTDGAKIARGRSRVMQGIAWDGGAGIRRVEVSRDAGLTWEDATLGQDLGRYSFRPWSYRFRPDRAGALTLLVRATNTLGSTQPAELIFNNPGYHNNVIQSVTVEVV